MNGPDVLGTLASRRSKRRNIAWAGAVFIILIAALAVHGIVQSYHGTVESTRRELDTQARVIAEQTARSIQAVDVVLRHLVAQLQEGALKSSTPDELHLYLKEQAVGLVQTDGLVIINGDGSLRAVSQAPPARVPKYLLAEDVPFQASRDEQGLLVHNTMASPGTKRMVFPIARRLVAPGGEFAGVAGAPGLVDYFQNFYRDTYGDASTRISLLHRKGWLLARHPRTDNMLGRMVEGLDALLPKTADASNFLRRPSPIDGVDHYVAIRLVPDYPLAIAVSRDVQTALAPWRRQSINIGLGVFAFAALAAGLLWLTMRQFTRLSESEERFALAVAGANDGIIDWDVPNNRLFFSDRAKEIVGIQIPGNTRPREEWMRLLSFHPEDLPAVHASFRWIEEPGVGGEIRETEHRVQSANGVFRWVRVRGMCIRGADGQPLRWAGSVSDIEPYKQVESQLLQARKLEAIGTLAGGIAHDFNNILAAILGYGEMAQKGAAEGTPLRRHVDAVVSAGLRAKSLVERILAFSRSGIGERKPVHVESAVAEALNLVAASLPREVQLVRKLSAGGTAVTGDATQFHQVVMNLCANGAQAMKAGGELTVTLDVVEKKSISVATSTLTGGRYVRLIVRDTGTGIDARVLERIFDPFFTTKEVGVGTGLGLSLVHGIVTDLGGGIEVESRVGVGTEFTVYFPVCGSAVEATRVETRIAQGAGETILLVDDEEPLVHLGEEMIAGLGYEPVGFTSSAAALEAFRADPQRFDAVLSDENMPGMTGTELARAMRAIRPDLPVVLMSGYVSAELTARAREAGVREVLSKPVVVNDIARGLANAVRDRRNREGR